MGMASGLALSAGWGIWTREYSVLLPRDLFTCVLEGCWTMIECWHADIEEFPIILHTHMKDGIQDCFGTSIDIDISVITARSVFTHYITGQHLRLMIAEWW
jgi:hypothetical protein